MEITLRPLTAAGMALTAASAIALGPIALPMTRTALPDSPLQRASGQAVQLADAWSTLFADTAENLQGLWASANGVQGPFSSGNDLWAYLPATSNPVAPILEQVVLNLATYAGQLVSGQGAQIPTEITQHLNEVMTRLQQYGPQVPRSVEGLGSVLATAFNTTVQYVQSNNPLEAAAEAPAVFLDAVFNSLHGVLGPYGPVNWGLTVRNVVTNSIDPPLPAWLSRLIPASTPSAAKPATSAVATPAVAVATVPTLTKPSPKTLTLTASHSSGAHIASTATTSAHAKASPAATGHHGHSGH